MAEDERPARRPLEDPGTLGVTAVTGIFLLALLAAVEVARPLLFPIVLALLFSFLLRTPVRWLQKAKVPKAASAAVLLILLVGGFGWGVYQLRTPAAEWLSNAPRTLEGLERKIGQLRGQVARVSEAAAKVEEMTEVDREEERDVQQVRVKEPTLLETVMQSLPAILGSAVVTVVLLYLLLVFDEDLLRNVVRTLPSLEEKRRIVQIARQTESTISRYLLTITVINGCLGAVIAVLLGWVGVPNPWLWGVMAGLLNFVPYLGGVVGVTIVAVVALTSLDDPLRALAAPVAYTVVNSTEGLVITPIILGSRFSLNPVLIFVWLLLWGWLWGIGGALIAVPLLTVLKIVCDHTPSLRSFGELLGRTPGER